MNQNISIVTGGASGIGAAIARLLALEGYAVVIVDNNSGRVVGSERSGSSLLIEADVSKSSEVARAIHQTIEKYGRVDVLVNDAGIPSFHELADTTEEEWDNVLDTNLKGAFLMTRAVLPHMIEQKRGSILNVSSAHGLTAAPGRAAYAVSKAGLISLTKVTAIEYSGFGIRCNCVCPGVIDTPMTRGAQSNVPKLSSMGANASLNRMGTAEEVAELAVFILSDKASYVTGAVVSVDGGRTAGFPRS